jgi:hypothetical protein
VILGQWGTALLEMGHFARGETSGPIILPGGPAYGVPGPADPPVGQFVELLCVRWLCFVNVVWVVVQHFCNPLRG